MPIPSPCRNTKGSYRSESDAEVATGLKSAFFPSLRGVRGGRTLTTMFVAGSRFLSNPEFLSFATDAARNAAMSAWNAIGL